MVDTCHHTFFKIHRMNTKSEPYADCGLWVMIMCQCWLIDCHKGTLLVGMAVWLQRGGGL